MVKDLFRPLGTPPTFPLHSPSAQFNPRQIAGLEYWFDAQDLATLYQDSTLSTLVTANGNPVGGWRDKVNNRNLVQATNNSRPTYRSAHINGRPAVEADGVDDYLRYSGTTLSQPLSIYFVGRLNSTAVLQRWLDSALTNQVSVLVTAGAIRRMAAPTTMDAGTANTNPHVHSCIFNSTTSSYYVDGSLAGGPADVGTNAMDGLTLFAARGGGSNPLSGAIGELLIYSGSHSTAQRAMIELYLKRRWGI